MTELRIAGGRPLTGRPALQGSKNSALSLIPLCLLAKKNARISNLPDTTDIRDCIEILKHLGCEVKFADGVLQVDPSNFTEAKLPVDVCSRSRVGIYFVPLLLYSFGEAYLPALGGCDLGSRSTDIHDKIFEAFGVTIRKLNDGTKYETIRLNATNYKLKFPSHMGSQNALAIAALCEGSSNLDGMSLNPELLDRIAVLTKLGASISSEEERSYQINGGILKRDFEIENQPDRVNLASIIAFAIATNGWVEIPKAAALTIKSELEVLCNMGVHIKEVEGNFYRIAAPKRLVGTEFSTAPYPGFCTDAQPLFTALLCMAKSESVVHELMFENRFSFAAELEKFGASLKVKTNQSPLCPNGKPSQSIHIQGLSTFLGATVGAKDLRGGAALTLAALAARGNSIIYDAHHILRGYERIDQTLTAMGAAITVHD